MTDTDIDIYRNSIVELLNQIGIQVEPEAIEELLKGNRKNNLIRLVSQRRSSDTGSFGAIFNNILNDLTLDSPRNPVQLD